MFGIGAGELVVLAVGVGLLVAISLALINGQKKDKN